MKALLVNVCNGIAKSAEIGSKDMRVSTGQHADCLFVCFVVRGESPGYRLISTVTSVPSLIDAVVVQMSFLFWLLLLRKVIFSVCYLYTMTDCVVPWDRSYTWIWDDVRLPPSGIELRPHETSLS